MSEDVSSPRFNPSGTLQVIEISVKPDLPQRHDYLCLLKALHFAVKIGRAIPKFLRKRFVLGWRAANCCRDVEIAQHETIVAIGCERLTGKTDFMQHGIHEVAG